MSFLPDELAIDESVDTNRMAPEDDFASPADPSIPRKGQQANWGDPGTDSYYGAQPHQGSRDLSAADFQQPGHGNLPNAFTQPTADQFPHPGRQQPELVGDIPGEGPPQYSDPTSGNTPVVEPGNDEGDVDQDNDIPEELLRAAGLTEAKAREEFDSVEDLKDAVLMLDRRAVTRGKELLARQPQQPNVEDIVVGDEDTWTPPEPENGWDDNERQLVTSMTDYFKSQLAKRDEQLKAQQDSMQQFFQEQRQNEQMRSLREFDEMVQALPDEYQLLFGRGYMADLDPHSMQFDNRAELENTMIALQEGNRLRGRAEIPQDELMIRALGVAFPDVHRQTIRREVVEEVDGRQRMMTARPSHRHAEPFSPEVKAGLTAQEWYDQHNMSNDDLDNYSF